VSLDDVRERVRAVVGAGEGMPTGQIPFTPHAKKTLELALREEQALGDSCIGTEHILLGLVRANEDVSAQILADLGYGPDRVRDEVLRLRGSRPAGRFEPRPFPHPGGYRRRFLPPVSLALLVFGWVLFALALGAGILIGWAIWH
jgi:ATP-dependent Clp protease ATP-binding subunit ClpA